jgi:hypothetical protein
MDRQIKETKQYIYGVSLVKEGFKLYKADKQLFEVEYLGTYGTLNRVNRRIEMEEEFEEGK